MSLSPSEIMACLRSILAQRPDLLQDLQQQLPLNEDDHRGRFSIFAELQNIGPLALGVVLAPMPVSALAPLSRTSKELRLVALAMLCEKWVAGLMATRIYGTDPVGAVPSALLPMSIATTASNLEKARHLVSLVLPPHLHHLTDEILVAWGVGNLCKKKDGGNDDSLRRDAGVTMRGLNADAKALGHTLKVILCGYLWEQNVQVRA